MNFLHAVSVWAPEPVSSSPAPSLLTDLPLLVVPASDGVAEIIWFTAIPVALGFLIKFYRDWRIDRESPRRSHHHPRHARRRRRPPSD